MSQLGNRFAASYSTLQCPIYRLASHKRLWFPGALSAHMSQATHVHPRSGIECIVGFAILDSCTK